MEQSAQSASINKRQGSRTFALKFATNTEMDNCCAIAIPHYSDYSSRMYANHVFGPEKLLLVIMVPQLRSLTPPDSGGDGGDRGIRDDDRHSVRETQQEGPRRLTFLLLCSFRIPFHIIFALSFYGRITDSRLMLFCLF